MVDQVKPGELLEHPIGQSAAKSIVYTIEKFNDYRKLFLITY
nr:MAG TPA: hypothetical protein [Caudoviricetes sp.]